MSNNNIVRVWKDAEYREDLSAVELSSLPTNPVGVVNLLDSDLSNVIGGKAPDAVSWTWIANGTVILTSAVPSVVHVLVQLIADAQ